MPLSKQSHLANTNRYLFLLFLLLLTCKSAANQAVLLTDQQNNYSIYSKVQLFEDTEGKVDFDQIMSSEYRHKFSPLNSAVNNTAFNTSIYWLKFSVLNISDIDTWLIENSYVGIQYVDLYFVEQSGKVNHQASGRLRPVLENGVNIFKIKPPKNKEVTYFIKIKTNSPKTLNYSIFSEQALFAKQHANYFLSGLFIGLMLFLMVINVVFFISIKITSQLYLAGYLFGMVSAYGFYDGYILTILPGYMSQYATSIMFVTSAIGQYCLYLYCCHLVFKHQKNTLSQSLFKVNLLVWLGVLCCHWFYSELIAYQAYILSIMLTPILCLIICFYALKQKQHHARFVIAGLCFLSLGYLLKDGHQLGAAWPSEYIYLHSDKLGILALAFCFSLATLDYVRFIRNKHKVAERKFSQVFEQVYQMLFIVSSQGTIISANSTVNKYTKVPSDQLVGKAIDQVFTTLRNNLDRIEITDKLKLALTGELSQSNIKIFANEGSLHNIELSFQPFIEENETIEKVVVQARDVTKQANAFNAIQDMLIGVAGLTGENFFSNLVVEISRIYKAKYVMLSLINNDKPQTAYSLVLSKNKRIIPNINYLIKNTPSERLLNKHLCNYPDNVSQHFPEDEWLKTHNVRSYLGVSIKDRHNNVIGFLSVMDDKPLHEDNYFIEVLAVFASRAANELQQQRAQSQLKKALDKVDFHISNTPLGVIEWDQDFNIVNWNKAAERIFGFSLHHFKNQNPLEILVPNEQISEIEHLAEEIIKNKGGQYSLNKNNTLDGRTILCEWYNTPLLDKEKNVIGVASLVNDVTAEHEALNALYLKEHEQREIFNALLDAIFIVNQEGQIETVNKAASTLFGYKSHELVGQNINKLMPKANLQEQKQFIQTYLTSGEIGIVDIGKELKAVKKAGEIFPIHLSVSTLPKDKSGKLRFIGTCHDLSVFKQQQETIRQSQKMDALGKLTGGIAHDFNNLLGIINGYCELLTASLSTDTKLLNYAEQIHKASSRGAKLTKKLLSFASKNTMDTETVNINELLLDEFEMLQKTITPRINLTYMLDDDLPHTQIDKAELEDCILNITINAMHAIENQGEITISTATLGIDERQAKQVHLMTGQYILLGIADSGCGMDDATKQKALDPFFTTKGKSGTGLGLSQVYGFVERSQGRLQIESTEGIGTQVQIILPIITGAHKALEEKPKQTMKPSPTCTILIVDDEPDLVTVSSAFLTDEGYNVLTAYSGKEALELINKHVFNLVLCDVIMPNMDGFSLAQKVHQTTPELPFLFASGYHDNKLTEEQQSLVQNALRKPYTKQALLHQVSEVLKRDIPNKLIP